VITHLLNRIGDVRRNVTPADDGDGGTIAAFTSVGSLPCRRSPAGARELAIAAQLQVKATHVLYCDPDTLAVQLDDEIVLDGEAWIYAVRGFVPPSLPHHRKILVEELQRGGQSR
jgi:hypothetical protein